MVEECRTLGKVLGTLNSTFIALIPKQEDAATFDDYRLITLCDLIYKLISKTIANKLKGIVSSIISEEHFGFLFIRKIHDALAFA